MNTIHMTLNPSPFEKIKAGTKTIELRLFDPKRQSISIGDTIIFSQRDTSEELSKTVIALHKAENFHDLLTMVDPNQCGWKANETVDPGLMENYYAKEDIEKYGVVGIEIR